MGILNDLWLRVVAIMGTVTVIYRRIKLVYRILEPLVKPMIEDAENRAKDGIIDKADRKEIAMGLIANAQARGKLRKFGFFERIMVSKIVDWIAQKLPDFKFNQQ